jgi:hypothetical protein
MAIHAEGRCLGFAWQPQPDLCALFDSPDRQFASGGHLLGLLFPGSDGVNREQRSLLPYQPRLLPARQPLRVRAWLFGHRGETIVPAAHGWLDSKIRETNRYRHAFWPGFGPQPASDAALWMFWLAGRVSDPVLQTQLHNASADALIQVTPADLNDSQIGHLHYPLPALVFESTHENAHQAEIRGRSLLGRFQSCYVCVNGFRAAPKVSINDRDVSLTAPHQYHATAGHLVLQLIQESTIELRYPATAFLKIRAGSHGGQIQRMNRLFHDEIARDADEKTIDHSPAVLIRHRSDPPTDPR